MPQLIDSIYVHQAVEEADIPRRRAAPDVAMGETALPLRSLSPGPWFVTGRAPAFRTGPPQTKAGRDLSPIFIIMFFVWILFCCIVKIAG